MSKSKLGLIVAADRFGNIGYQNGIPWRLKGDLANFKSITMGQVVIMGRNTWESLPGFLQGRINIVVSSKLITFKEGDEVLAVPSIEHALDAARRYGTDWIYFIGGTRIYEAAMPLVEKAHVTVVHQTGIYDTRTDCLTFPASEWDIDESIPAPEIIDPETGFGVPSHTYTTFIRKTTER